MSINGYILGLDVGDKRIGVALASEAAKLPRPLAPLENNQGIYKKIAEIVKTEGVKKIVIGLPRNQDGQETAQSQKVRSFAQALKNSVDPLVVFADESLSSVRAEEIPSVKKDQTISTDSLAACFILDEFFATLGIQ